MNKPRVASSRPPLIVTIDTERDKGPKWSTPPSVTFRSVLEAIPRRLKPLFEEFGVRPTYFLSPEVLSSAPCMEVLREQPNCELASHLHVEYVAPNVPTWDLTDTSVSTILMQRELPPTLERRKLETLTELY